MYQHLDLFYSNEIRCFNVLIHFLVFSEQLRRTLEDYKHSDRFLASFVSAAAAAGNHVSAENLQLQVWQPRPTVGLALATSTNCDDDDTSISKSSIDATHDSPTTPAPIKAAAASATPLYIVEEPSEFVRSEKSKLKRSHSQLRTLNIEEITQKPKQQQAINTPASKQVTFQFYLVDEHDDLVKQQQLLHSNGGGGGGERGARHAVPSPTSSVNIVEIVDEAQSVEQMDIA